MKRRFQTIFLFHALLLMACGSDIDPGRSSGEPPVITGLGIETVQGEMLAGTEYFVGTVESLDRATLTARIDGRVDRVRVKAGDHVTVGDVLLTIADTPAAAQLSAADSYRQAAAARSTLAEQTLARYERLKASEAVTPQEYDRVASEAGQARGALKAAEAAVEQARTIAGYPRVTAPYAARIVSTAVEAGTTVMPGTPLLVLDSVGGWQVRLTCPEALAGRIAIGTVLQVEVPSLQRSFPSTVREVAPAADPASRSFQVKAAMPDDPELAAGLFARAAHASGATDTLLIPAAAVVTRGQLTGVYVVDAGILRWRLIKTGRSVGERVEVLTGLGSGEQLVVSGTDRAVNGARLGK